MAFFDNFSKKVQDFAFVATEKAQQVAAVAGEKANAVADKAKTEYEMASERRSMDKNYRAIGEWYVSTLEGDAPEAVADIVAAIKASQEKLAAYEAAKEGAGAHHRGDHREGRGRGSARCGGTQGAFRSRGDQGGLNPSQCAAQLWLRRFFQLRANLVCIICFVLTI